MGDRLVWSIKGDRLRVSGWSEIALGSEGVRAIIGFGVVCGRSPCVGGWSAIAGWVDWVRSLHPQTQTLGFLGLSQYDVDMKFEWDPSKAVTNLKKPDVSFEEAQTVFENPLAVIFEDEAHSMTEH